MFRRNKSKSIIFPAEFSLPIAVDFILSHSLKTRSPMSTLLKRFVPILRVEWHPYTVEGAKCGVGAFVRCCRQERFCPSKRQKQHRGNGREAGEIAQPPGHCLPLFKTRFLRIWLRQTAQDKGRAEGLKRKQDKGRASQVTPARVTSPRSAGRFKGFRALEHGRMWGSHLSLGAHFGVWYCANAHGWPLSAGVNAGVRVKIVDLVRQKSGCSTQQALHLNKQNF